MWGIEEPSKDLETLKHILKALELNGLLHSKKAKNQMSHQNFVYDRNGESPIIVMKPAMSPARRISRGGNELPPLSFRLKPSLRRNTNEVSPAVSPRCIWPIFVHNFDVDKRCECTTTNGVRTCLLAIYFYFYFYFFHSPYIFSGNKQKLFT